MINASHIEFSMPAPRPANVRRAMLIGWLGPALSAAGLAWVALNAVLDPAPEPATLRYFMFDAPHLMITVGIAVSFLFVPLAVQVALSGADDTDIPDFSENPMPGESQWSSM
jgi:hypothetical protein